MITDIKNAESIRLLLDKFYLRAGQDKLLKPIISGLTNSGFRNESLYRYWHDAIFGNSTQERTAPPKHMQLMSSSQHFTRWLTIFFQTIDDLFLGPVAEKAKVLVIRKAEQFKTSLEIDRF